MESSTATTMAMTAVRAPHTVRLNTSNPPTVVPQICSRDGAACVGNATPSSPLICAYPYGAIHGANTATSRKNPVSTRPVTSMPFCQPTAVSRTMTAASLCWDSPDARHPARRLWFPCFHSFQYRTRGSINALITSTMKLTTETMIAIRITMPCTATKSRAFK